MLITTTSDKDFRKVFQYIKNRGELLSDDVERTVRQILDAVKHGGDKELVRFTLQFDGHADIVVKPGSIAGARKKISTELMRSIRLAYQRIEAFHRKQLRNSWIHTAEHGAIAGQIVRPLQRVGLYVPGGKAVYPSSVLMNAIPAIVAGVSEIIMVTPGASGSIDPVILAAAELCGIKKIYQVGGAQAVAAMAYGTETVPQVDKIVGPGNIFVATAKRLVYGTVDIDMVAGPSEVLIISDGTSSPAWVAADMLSQAEHDEMASAILISTDQEYAENVIMEIKRQVQSLPKRKIAEASIAHHGAVIIASNLQEGVALANEIAPEHLELYVKDPWSLLGDVRNAGAVFLGYHTPEAVGDYVAGPNHVLPTGGSARFFSPLSVDDFIKKMSLIAFTPEALEAAGEHVIRIACSEKLDAHARSVEKRLHPSPLHANE